MLFTSMEFLFMFFPLTLGFYFLLPTKARNYWLLLASLFFYAWGEPKFVAVMLFSILWNYLMALRIAELEAGTALRKLVLAIAVCVDLGILFVYKYMNFVTGTIHSLAPGANIPVTSFVLPIGISFFTFQSVSYVIDVYRGTPVQKNPAYLGLYIALFPQLIAGPIVRYTTIEDQINERRVTWEGFCGGMLRFLYGFNKKMLLANLLSQAADAAFGAGTPSVALAWLGAVCYSLQIFFDFCGYSEMAIGLGEMFGFHFLENFNYPYISKTVTEFWRRWHISLGSWFRDYIYFPLGGSRVGSKWRLVFNLFVVWLATGVWHGASWNFIVWGLLYGVLITVEKLLSLPQRLAKPGAAAGLYQVFTLLVVMFGWVLFRAADLPSALIYLRSMFGAAGNALVDDTFRSQFRECFTVLAAGLICSTPVWRILRERLSARGPAAASVCNGIACTVQFLLFLVGVSYLEMNAHNPFIYFNF
ncbi:MAG: MBOAT family protein [Clostridiales bacterium]|nr:MBOAT family protein [Clostridiales bacterium]